MECSICKKEVSKLSISSCYRTFAFPSSLRLHSIACKKTRTRRGARQCQACGRYYPTAVSYYDHVRLTCRGRRNLQEDVQEEVVHQNKEEDLPVLQEVVDEEDVYVLWEVVDEE